MPPAAREAFFLLIVQWGYLLLNMTSKRICNLRQAGSVRHLRRIAVSCLSMCLLSSRIAIIDGASCRPAPADLPLCPLLSRATWRQLFGCKGSDFSHKYFVKINRHLATYSYDLSHKSISIKSACQVREALYFTCFRLGSFLVSPLVLSRYS